jgi:hypothetical protein
MTYENARPWDKKHIEKVKETKRNWNKRHADQKKAIGLAYRSKPQFKSWSREYQAMYRQQVRIEVLEAYGGKCECCGETEKDFLCIDHINGGGREDLKRLGKGQGYAWYLYLKKEHPDHVRVLCHNCNFARGNYGTCPHERKTSI